jgi:hypothetical protein
MKGSIRHTALAAFACLATACGDASGPSQALPPLPTDFEVRVSGGTTPTISWEGGNADYFDISCLTCNTITTATAWSFAGSGSGFSSPVKYGTMPTASRCGLTTESCPNAQKLNRGATYMVFVGRVDGRIGANYITP